MPTGLEWLVDYGLREGDFPDVAGTYSGLLVIAGGGACVWDDLERLGCRWDMHRGCVRVPDGDLMCVNSIGMDMPGEVVHWYANGARDLRAWAAARRPEHRQLWEQNLSRRPIHYHSCNAGFGTCWPVPGHGSSGLNACLVGMGLGYERAVLCGIPVDDSPHYHDPPWRACNFTRESPDKYWERAKTKCFKGRVRSMSGRTREMLGEP